MHNDGTRSATYRGLRKRWVVAPRLPIRAVGCMLAVSVSVLILPPDVVQGTHAQGPDTRLPRVLNRRGESVNNIHVWADAVIAHAPNTFDSSAAEIAAWPAELLTELRVELLSLLALMDEPQKRSFSVEDDRLRILDVLYTADELDRLRRLARSLGGRDPLHADSRRETERAADAKARVLKRAAILHTDVARLAAHGAPDQQPPSRADGSGVVQFSDSRIVGVDPSADHWGFARNLLDALQAPSRDPAVRLWYRATNSWLIGAMRLEWSHFQRAQRLFPDDPQLLYLRGCLHETFASPVVQAIAASLGGTRQKNIVRSTRAELQDAESFLRRALAADPGLIEARLHLGRVQALMGKDVAATQELRQVLRSTTEPIVLYYANLFLGSALEALGQGDDARAAYERAATAYPDAGTPRLALSQLALRGGDRAGALAAIESMLNSRDNAAADPWHTYYVAAGRGADAELTVAYAALAAEGTR